MRTLRIVAARTFGEFFHRFASWAWAAAFMAVAGAFFAAELFHGEGGSFGVQALWARAADAALPFLAAAMSMRLWGCGRDGGRLALALCTPVPEREVAGGKFLGAWLFAMTVVVAFLSVPMFVLGFFSPSLGSSATLASFVPALAVLGARAALWCSVGTFAGIFARTAAGAFSITALAAAVPYAAYHAALATIPAVRESFAEYPLSSQVSDFAEGAVSPAQLVFCLAFSAAFVFAADKSFAARRWVGRGAFLRRMPFAVASALSIVLAAMLSLLAFRADFVVEWPMPRFRGAVSPRTRQILEEAHGELRATGFVSRGSPQFRQVGRQLRVFESAARSVGGVRFSTAFVDPRWDLGRAAALARAGIPENSIVLERGRRRLSIPLAEADESTIAATIQRLYLPARREIVRFTVGHGEHSPMSYDPATGMSDFARVLRRAGYEVGETDLSTETAVPADCAALVVAGAVSPFSGSERGKVDAYLKHGGRMLALVSSSQDSGVAPLVAEWGMQVAPLAAAPDRTRKGSDYVSGEFGAHRITRPLAGSEVVFAGDLAAISFDSSTNQVAAADRATLQSLVEVTTSVGKSCAAVALEKGGAAAEGLAQRPTRIVVVADPDFASNGALSERGHANADFLLNSIAFLAGIDAVAAADRPADVLATGMSRSEHVRFGFSATLALPALVVLLGLVFQLRRRA